MSAKGLWRLYFNLLKLEEAQDKRAWAWAKANYEGNFELHTEDKLFRVKVVAFAPSERKRLDPFNNFQVNDAQSNVFLKRQALTVHVPPSSVKSFDLLYESGVTLRWIGATLWKRLGKKEIAWMLLLSDVIVAEKGGTYEGDTQYYLVCREIKEMMPKSLVEPPASLVAL